MVSKKILAFNLVVLLLAGCGGNIPATDISKSQTLLPSTTSLSKNSAVVMPAKNEIDTRKTIRIIFKNSLQSGFNTKAVQQLFVKAIIDRINTGDHQEIDLSNVGGAFSFTITTDLGDEINIRIEARNADGVLVQEGITKFTVNATTKDIEIVMKTLTTTVVKKDVFETVINGSLNPEQVTTVGGSMTIRDNQAGLVPLPSILPSSPAPLPLPSILPSGSPLPTFGACGAIPLPPPDVMDRIKVENPSLLTQVQATQTMSFLDGYNTMLSLSQQYPQYFVVPPPLPADGTCPPPPPPVSSPVPSPISSPLPSGSPAPTYAACGAVPLPPPDVMNRISVENPSLLTQVQSIQSMSFLDGYNTMVSLAQQYPKYFISPPALPADGTCPPPPPPAR